MLVVSQYVKRFYREVKKELKLSYEEVIILNYLYNADSNEVSAREISRASGLEPYFLTKAMQRLREKGYISKKRNTVDERTVIIEVDEAQRLKVNEMIDRVNQFI